MVLGESACHGESFGLRYKDVIDENNEDSMFMMKSACGESRLMG